MTVSMSGTCSVNAISEALFTDCLAYLAGRLAARLRGQLRHHSQRWSAPLADLCFDGEPVPSFCHVRQDGLHPQIWLAFGHSPTLRGMFLTLSRTHNALPRHLFRGWLKIILLSP